MILNNDLAFVDTETTGLELEHDIWEVAVAIGEGRVDVFQLVHSLKNAVPEALAINGYKVRYNSSFVSPVNDLTVAQILQGKTIVGANPSFDAYRLARRWGRAPWHYRLVDVESMAVPLFNLDKPLGLKGLVDKLRDLGYTIPENDHTAEADVLTVREVYRSLRQMGENPRREGW
jgi:DNA polymerase III epsilon subunit-like protein